MFFLDDFNLSMRGVDCHANKSENKSTYRNNIQRFIWRSFIRINTRKPTDRPQYCRCAVHLPNVCVFIWSLQMVRL